MGSGMELHKAQEIIDEEKMKKKIAEWTPEQEKILKIWAEKSAGYRFLHQYAADKNRKLNDRLSFGSMILTTLSSIGGFSDMGTAVMYTIAGMNIISTFLNAIQRFYRSAEKAETHSEYARQFASLYRNVVVELTLAPEHRARCNELSKLVRADYERLVNGSPNVPHSAVAAFHKKFKDVKSKPDICNGLTEIKVYTRHDSLINSQAIV